MESISIRNRLHTGWQAEEDERLFTEVKAAREMGMPLRSAFDKMEKLTGRRANSIRNYYYARIRDEDVKNKYSDSIEKAESFIPFSDEEVVEMLEYILSSQANGMSVRAATMTLGNGKSSLMLRYQNKYRTVLKQDPELVMQVISSMKARGVACFDPYNDKRRTTVGRPKKEDNESVRMIEAVSKTVSDLESVEGLDVTALFESLGALALSASTGAKAIKQLGYLRETGEYSDDKLREENAELREKLIDCETQLSECKADFMIMLSNMKKLVRINSGFLELTGVAKVSALGNYIRELSSAVSDCRNSVNL